MKDKIKGIVSKILKFSVDDDTSQSNCDAWDSLNHLQIVFELEMEFKVSFEPDEMVVMKDIKSITDIIVRKI